MPKKDTLLDKVELRPIADLVFNPDNPREIKDEEIAALADSIAAHPRYFTARPVILSDRTGVLMIIAGEQRTKAAQYLGRKEVPTILLSGLSEEEEGEIMIRDNTHSGKWSEAKLRKWSNENLHRWNTPGWQVADENALKGLFENHEAKPKPTFLVVEIPVGEDPEPIREAIANILTAWPKCKVK